MVLIVGQHNGDDLSHNLPTLLGKLKTIQVPLSAIKLITLAGEPSNRKESSI